MSNTLFISDLHIPFQHSQAFRFLRELKREYKPTLIVNVGDEVDWHSVSRHPKDPDGLSAGDELKAMRAGIKELESIFPKMLLCTSNHGSRPYRKAAEVGIPADLMKSYNDYLKVGPGWEWAADWRVGNVYVNHGEGGEAIMKSRRLGLSVIQGHLHEKAYIQHWADPFHRTHWAAQTGCLVDVDSYAMAYGKPFINKPVIGTVVLVGGEPRYVRP